jgi:hypothetical protein
MEITFQHLIDTYPTEEKNELFTDILAGGFTDLINNSNYNNTCAMRISVMLNSLPGNYSVNAQWGTNDGGHKDQVNNHILIKVKSAHDYVKLKFGEPFWGMTKEPGSLLDYSTIPRERGILMYHANFSNAYGHIDLWDKDSCVYNCPTADIQLSYMISFWKFM